MKKLTFERAILIVLIMILFISTTEIRGRYTEIIKDRLTSKASSVSSDIQTGKNNGFPTMMQAADNLYKQGDYVKAAEGYLALSINSALSTDQRARASFRLGVCQYNLKNYQLAFESFVKASNLNTTDSVTYNNAAVSAYRAKDMKNAIEYETKALKLLPAVEYYYNLARIYEDNEQYDLAASNYMAVAVAEQNITETDRIDPVRVKEKVARLLSNSKNSVTSNIIIGLKLKNVSNEVLTVNDNEMVIKPGDFTVRVENQKGTKNILAEYDRRKYDPYNLISDMIWTVYKNGKQIYKKNSDKINISTADSGSYEVKLNIRYNGNKEKVATKTITLSTGNSTISGTKNDDITHSKTDNTDSKTYKNTIYEQLFESDFAISTTGNVDKYNVIWGKDAVETGLSRESKNDKLSSLLIENTSKRKKGIWVILDSLLQGDKNKGKYVTVSFYGKRVSPDADINLIIRVKSNNSISTTQIELPLSFNWEQRSEKIFIPNDATGFTISLSTNPGEQVNIDSFTIYQ